VGEQRVLRPQDLHGPRRFLRERPEAAGEGDQSRREHRPGHVGEVRGYGGGARLDERSQRVPLLDQVVDALGEGDHLYFGRIVGLAPCDLARVADAGAVLTEGAVPPVAHPFGEFVGGTFGVVHRADGRGQLDVFRTLALGGGGARRGHRRLVERVVVGLLVLREARVDGFGGPVGRRRRRPLADPLPRVAVGAEPCVTHWRRLRAGRIKRRARAAGS
jgi:hypothetical protein